MAIGINLDTEYAERTGIPSGGAGTLSQGGFADFFAGVWLYRPSATATYALTAAGSIIHCQAGAREVIVGFNSAGSVLADLNLQIIYNSGGGTGTPYLFTGHTGASFLDEWVYYFIYEDASNNLVGGYILLSDLNTAVTNSYANDNAGSQYINSLTFGCDSAHGACVLGHYALARARDSAASAANVLTYASSDTTISGDWGFWELTDNTDTADTSGNSRALTFSSGLSSESSPTFALTGTIAVTTANDTSSASGTGFSGYTPRRRKGFLGTGSFGAGNFGEWLQGSVSSTPSGSITVTTGNDTSSASGTTTVTGSISRTLTNDTSAITGTTTVTGTITRTIANDTSTIQGSPVDVGTIAVTVADDTMSASGSVGAAVTGTIAVTLGDDTSATSGTTTVTGTISVTLSNDTSTASGTTTVTGTITSTLSNDTSSISGSVGSSVSGTITSTLANDTSAASGTTTITGTISATLNNDTSAMSGSPVVSGLINQTLQNDTMTATGTSGVVVVGAGTKLPMTGVGV